AQAIPIRAGSDGIDQKVQRNCAGNKPSGGVKSLKRRRDSLLVDKGMNKGNRNHKKEQVAGGDANQKRSAVTVDEALGGLEEKYDEVQKLIDIGKEKGYLLYDEV